MNFKLMPNQFLHSTHFPMFHIEHNTKPTTKPYHLKMFFPTSVIQLGKISRARTLMNQTRISNKSLTLEALELFSLSPDQINQTKQTKQTKETKQTNGKSIKEIKGKSL